ncbi:MAG TPA: hypothetical protein PLK94_08315 [Alphaproteobacteria bacterium]|nr:hypothetical protein [Alphaproteobacteria bacterium]
MIALAAIPYSPVVLPFVEVIALIVLLVSCLLFDLSRCGLIIAYVFSYRWGWMLLDEKRSMMFFFAYCMFGVLTGTLAVIALLRASR